MTIEQNEPLYAASWLSMPPPTIQIKGNDSRVLLTIKPDGTVEGEVADASEAARVFCDSIPHSLKDKQRRLGIIEGLEMAAKVVHSEGHEGLAKAIRALIEEQKV